MDKKDIVRYKKIKEMVVGLKCKSIGDFASGNEIIRKFLDKKANYYSYDYPEYDLEKSFEIKEKLDCAISSEVLEHLRNPRTFLNSLSRFMPRGSKLILTTPNSAFIKNRINLFFGKTPLTFFGPSYLEAIYGKNYSSLSKEEKLNLDFQLHVRSYNYVELKKILRLEGFKIIKRSKLRYPGLKGLFLYLLPLNFQGCHVIIAELKT